MKTSSFENSNFIFNPSYIENRKNVFGAETDVGQLIQDHYKISSEMARQAIDRRLEIHKFFIASFGGAAAAAVAVFRLFEGPIVGVICASIGCLGMFLAFVWVKWIYFLIEQSSCRQVVLVEIEKMMPVSHWGAINNLLSIKSLDIKTAERALPIIFLLLSLLLTIASIRFF